MRSILLMIIIKCIIIGFLKTVKSTEKTSYPLLIIQHTDYDVIMIITGQTVRLIMPMYIQII